MSLPMTPKTVSVSVLPMIVTERLDHAIPCRWRCRYADECDEGRRDGGGA
jgi:hypothetical protein